MKKYSYNLNMRLGTIALEIFSWVLLLALFFIVLHTYQPAPVVCIIIFNIIFITMRFIKVPDIIKFISGLVSIAIFVFMVKISNLDFPMVNAIGFYLPILFAYFFDSFILPILFGLALVWLFAGFYGAEVFSTIVGNSVGIVFICIIYDVVFYFIKKLNNDRNKFKELSMKDQLTGLMNLNYVIEAGENIISQGSSVTSFILDIDYFKNLNDTFGHLVGNKVLLEISNKLKDELKNVDCIIGRLGGDEFVILLKNYSYKESVEIAGRIKNCLLGTYFDSDSELQPIKISCSLGMAYSPAYSSVKMQDLINKADTNMYYNKQRKEQVEPVNKIGRKLIEEQRILVNSLMEKDMYSYVHSQYVAYYASSLASKLGLPNKKVEDIYIAGWLHDIGKVLIPNRILRKIDKLTDKEYNMIKTHVTKGINILSGLKLSDTVLNAVKFHHERYDGKGYPYGISGNEIPLEARILQIADSFSAMTVKRVYRELISKEKALIELKENNGGQFDPDLVEAFNKLFESIEYENYTTPYGVYKQSDNLQVLNL